MYMYDTVFVVKILKVEVEVRWGCKVGEVRWGGCALLLTLKMRDRQLDGIHGHGWHCCVLVQYMRTTANEVRHCTVAGLTNNDMLICFEGNMGRKQTHVTSKHETSFWHLCTGFNISTIADPAACVQWPSKGLLLYASRSTELPEFCARRQCCRHGVQILWGMSEYDPKCDQWFGYPGYIFPTRQDTSENFSIVRPNPVQFALH